MIWPLAQLLSSLFSLNELKEKEGARKTVEAKIWV